MQSIQRYSFPQNRFYGLQPLGRPPVSVRVNQGIFIIIMIIFGSKIGFLARKTVLTSIIIYYSNNLDHHFSQEED